MNILLVLMGVLFGIGITFGSLILRRVYADWRMKQRWTRAGKHWSQFLTQMEAVQWDDRWAKNYQNKEIPLEDYYDFLEERRKYDESTGVVPQKETSVSKLSRKLEGYPTFGRKVGTK